MVYDNVNIILAKVHDQSVIDFLLHKRIDKKNVINLCAYPRIINQRQYLNVAINTIDCLRKKWSQTWTHTFPILADALLLIEPGWPHFSLPFFGSTTWNLSKNGPSQYKWKED